MMSWVGRISQRAMYFIGFIVVSILLAGAAYLELYQGVLPCPLCMLQRVILAMLGVMFLLGIVWSDNKVGHIFIGFLSVMLSIAGVVISGRQVWLQHVPAMNGENCDVSL